jgi:hypothetical protein
METLGENPVLGIVTHMGERVIVVGGEERNRVISADFIRPVTMGAEFNTTPYDYDRAVGIDDLPLVGNFTVIPGEIVATFEDGGQLTSLVLLNDNLGFSNLNPPLGAIIFSTKGEAGRPVKWMYTKPGEWTDVYEQYVEFVAFKIKLQGKDMIKDNGPIERKVIHDRDKPDVNDPVNIQAQNIKEMISNLFVGGDFNLTMNIEGRLMEDGGARITGNFDLTFKGSEE